MVVESVGLALVIDPAALPPSVEVVTLSPHVHGRLTTRHHYLCVLIADGRSVWVQLTTKPLESRPYLWKDSKRGPKRWRESCSYAEPRVLCVAPLGTIARYADDWGDPCTVDPARLDGVLLYNAERALRIVQARERPPP